MVLKNNGIFNTASSFNKFWKQKYYKNEARFNDVFSRNSLPKKIKDGAYLINLDEYADVDTRWIALFCKKMKVFILIVLVLNIFLKKVKNLSEIKTYKLISFEYNKTIQ